MPFDYSTAPAPRGDLEAVPQGTIATVSLHIKAGSVGEDGMLTRSQDGSCEMLVAEFTIIDGPYKGRKIWERMILVGSTPGHAQAIDISHGTLKAILDATRGLKPDDMSDAARAARTVELRAFEGATFLAKLGIEKGGPVKDKPGEFWPDKNTLAMVITNDKKEWRPIDQPPQLPVERPSWA
jgi:hypothetical protein